MKHDVSNNKHFKSFRVKRKAPSGEKKETDQRETNSIIKSHLQLIDERGNLQRLAGQLNALSPLAVMERGFSLVRDEAQTVVGRAAQLKADQAVTIDFADGTADAIIRNKPTLKVEETP